MADRDRPDPNLPLTNAQVELDLDGLTPAEAVKLIEETAAKLIDPRIEVDRDSWETVKFCGKRHMTPGEFENERRFAETRRRRQEEEDRAVLQRIRAEHPDWLGE